MNFAQYILVHKADSAGAVGAERLVVKQTWFERYGIPLMLFGAGFVFGFVAGWLG